MTREADRIVGLYDRHADAYDNDRVRTLYERSWLDRFRALLPASGAILDIGCGMAEPIARYLIGKGHVVTGVDSSPRLIAMARARFPDGDWIVGDMRRLSLGRAFDGVLAWDSFFHLTRDDQRAMFPIFRAHAAPNAALMFTSGPDDGEAIGRYQDEPLYHSSLAPEEYRRLLEDHGFGVVTHTPGDATCAGHTIWLARIR